MIVPPAWQIESEGSETLPRLSGDWLLHDGGLQVPNDVHRVVANLDRSTRLRFDATSVVRWDSSLLAFIWLFLVSSNQAKRRFDLDPSGLPAPLRRMLSLALSDHRESLSPGQTIMRPWDCLTEAWRHLVALAELIGMTALSILPGLRGRIASRSSDIVAMTREAGALGIVAIVNMERVRGKTAEPHHRAIESCQVERGVQDARTEANRSCSSRTASAKSFNGSTPVPVLMSSLSSGTVRLGSKYAPVVSNKIRSAQATILGDDMTRMRLIVA